MAHPDTIMRQRFSDATVQYQLAELTGVRFVGMSETKRDVKLEESTVKQITGNDTISARSPYGRPFGYRPQFKIWFSTNHKPEIPDGSEAIWDRLKLIPFEQRFAGDTADTELPEKLRKELPGVLTWAVRGCVEWVQNGLGTAKAVEAATAEYREDTDVIERFFTDVCKFGPDEWLSKGDLFEAWESWCFDEGEDPGKLNGFSRTMKERGVVKGFESRRSKKSTFWAGISLVPENDTPQESPAKHGGVVDPVYHSPDFSKVSPGPLRDGIPLENSRESYIDTPDGIETVEFEEFGE